MSQPQATNGSHGGPEHHLLQQAPVVPLDASGFTASVVGTILFALATIALGVWSRGTWFYVAATGTASGFILIAYTAWHRARARRRAQDPQSNITISSDTSMASLQSSGGNSMPLRSSTTSE